MIRTSLAIALTLTLFGASPLALAQDGGDRPADADDVKTDDAADAKPKKSDWKVDDPGMPSRTLSFETTEGTWMSVDVHPDGTRLVFDLLGDLYTLPIAGGTATRVTSGLAYDLQPRWSPDGTKLLFTSDRGGGDNIWWMPADGGEAKAVTKENFRLLNNAVWHPSGDYIVARKHFTSGRSLGAGEMWMYRFPDGGKGVQLTKRKNDQQDAGEPELSPDGRFLFWSEDMSGGKTFQYNKDPNGVIYVIRRLDMETGEVRAAIRRPGGAVRPRVSPDGTSLAYVRRVRDRSVLAVWDLATGNSRDVWDGLSLDQQETWAIFGPYSGLDWTPDGKSIVVWAKGHLHRVDVATGKAAEIPFSVNVEQTILDTRRIEHSVAQESFDVKVVRWPQVTPDRQTAVFQALGKLYRKALPDGAPERVTSQEHGIESAPFLAGDGRTLVYVTWSDTEGGRIRRVNLDGSGGTVLVDTPGHYLSVAVSGDGSEIVYHRGGGDTYRGRLFAEEPGIYRVTLGSDQEPHLLTRSGRSPRFAPDGQRILLLEREGKKSALVSIDRIGSDRRVVATADRATDFAISPDGRWIAWEELWQTYVAPLPPVPGTFHVAPKMDAVPVLRLSDTAGTYLSWSKNSSTVHWSLGPDVFRAHPRKLLAKRRLADAREKKPKKDADGPRGVGASPTRLGWSVASDAPATDVYLVGGRIVHMDDDQITEDGVVHLRGNRIAAVGTRDEVPVPEGATTFDVSGTTIMPGLVDVHSHTGSSNGDLLSQQNWAFNALLAFGVTTTHDPSNNTEMIHAESELVRAGLRVGPRIFSTGTILYGAEGDFKAVVNSLADARQEVARTKAWGARSVKSYQQPRREQRQQVLKAAAELDMLVVPEGGSTFTYNMTHLLDGHTTLEHAIPIAPLYDAELTLIAESGTSYTPTLVVGYGGLWGENYWYAKTKVWENKRLLRFVPRSVVDPNARRRTLATDDDEYHHLRLAKTVADVVRRGGNAEIGAHGQLQGLGSHWETWMFEQGGLTPHEALRCATYGGAKAICLEHELGAIRAGYLADLIVVEGDPLANVRDSEKIRFTVANGRVYDARTLMQLAPERRPLPPGPALDTMGDEPGHANCACGR